MGTDPLTYTWDLLNDDLIQRLDSRPWVSMSLERELAIPCTDLNTFLQSKSLVSSLFPKELLMGPDKFKAALQYVYGPEQDDIKRSQCDATVFQARMPGAMTLKEVTDQINLDRWQLKLGSRLVHLEVRLGLIEPSSIGLANVGYRI